MNGCLSDQQLGTTMQILYVEKLQSLRYVQHTYAIIGNTCRFVHKCFQHIHEQQLLDYNKNAHIHS